MPTERSVTLRSRSLLAAAAAASVLAAVLTTGLATVPASAGDWPEFRGPTGDGRVPASEKLPPLELSLTNGVHWKVDVPGKGWSSPIVVAGRVYLTSAVPTGRGGDQSLRTLCFDAADGKLIWSTEVFRADAKAAGQMHQKNSCASPTPICDGSRVYVHFGHMGMAALGLDGQVLWTATEPFRYDPQHGNGSTPILVDGKLIVACDGADQQFVIAVDAATGKTAWKTDRRMSPRERFKFSFATALAITVGDKKQVVCPAAMAIVAYDPADGREIWRVRHGCWSGIPKPVFAHGLVVASTGFMRASLVAIRPDGRGDVTSSHIAWSFDRGAPNTPSPLADGDELYVVSDKGIATCLDAKAGRVVWQQRLPGANYSASPILVGDRIYCTSEDGVVSVLRLGRKFETLSVSKLEERTFASPAVLDGTLIVRTESQLYRFR